MITGGATDDLEEILAEGGILLPGPSNGESRVWFPDMNFLIQMKALHIS
jgi:hypothetical protein